MYCVIYVKIVCLADKERAAWKEIRALSLQLFADMQEFVAEDRLSQTELQEDYKFGAESCDTTSGYGTGNVQGDVRALSRYFSGEYDFCKTIEVKKTTFCFFREAVVDL